MTSSTLLPWQNEFWGQFAQVGNRLPHGILIYGNEGIGKVQFAHQLAKALLCEKGKSTEFPYVLPLPCHECESCHWFEQGNHPDLRVVRPESYEAELSESTADDVESEEGDKTEKGGEKKSKKNPSKEIVIDQVRQLGSFFNVSSHRNGNRVVLLYPVESINTFAANAILKTLEEPHPNTYLILVSHQIKRLLPTILSRCAKFAAPLPQREAALQWLTEQSVADAEKWLDLQGGAPLLAKALAESEQVASLTMLIKVLAKPSVEKALKAADDLHKENIAQLITWYQKWLHDLMQFCVLHHRPHQDKDNNTATPPLRYFPKLHQEMAYLVQFLHTEKIMSLQDKAKQYRAVANHPLSPKLFLESILLEYCSLFK